jgi:hypothetical protein
MTKKVIELNEYKQKHKITFNQQRPFDITDSVDEEKDILIYDEELSTCRIDQSDDPKGPITVLNILKSNREKFEKTSPADILEMIRNRDNPFVRYVIKNPRNKP